MVFFEYGETELTHLKKACPKLAAVINEAGMLKREVALDLFKSLISGIISQQISTKAAVTVFARVEVLVGRLTADNILAQTDEALQACGLSYRKVGYIKGICEAVKSGSLDLESLVHLTDEEVVAKLVALKGIGVWSAEMFLLFSLQRLDVLSYGDLVIRKGIMQLYDLDDLSKKEFDVYRKLYAPYGSIASLYLWELANDKQVSK
ncbi:MAG: DNA-3-methyladenine glycosylase [Defluviitaleaceae bacterium]|nr:DNA-3-methyladenine glycosylase [Defluviitaleaceae bacterium]